MGGKRNSGHATLLIQPSQSINAITKLSTCCCFVMQISMSVKEELMIVIQMKTVLILKEASCVLVTWVMKGMELIAKVSVL